MIDNMCLTTRQSVRNILKKQNSNQLDFVPMPWKFHLITKLVELCKFFEHRAIITGIVACDMA
jgi:hypothetical protein